MQQKRGDMHFELVCTLMYSLVKSFIGLKYHKKNYKNGKRFSGVNSVHFL